MHCCARRLVFAPLPVTALAGQPSPPPDGGGGETGGAPALFIGVRGVTEDSAELSFTAGADGAVYYTAGPSQEQAPDESAVLAGETAEITAGSELTAMLVGLATQTDYTVYGLLEDAAGSRSAVVSAQFTTGIEPMAADAADVLMGPLALGVGATFTANTSEGHTLTYKVLTEDAVSNTGTVQVGDGTNTAVTGGGSGSLTIPETVEKDAVTYTVTAVGDKAFWGCMGFTGTLSIPGSVTSIGTQAFASCRSFTGTLTLPANLISIGTGSFSGCKGFTGLVIPAKLAIITGSAFNGCSGLDGTLIIPDSVLSIEDNAFKNCTGLDGLTLGAGLRMIGFYAFSGCSGLTGTLIIPSAVTALGLQTFQGCAGLNGVRFLGDKPILPSSIFDGCAAGFTLQYNTGTTGWNGYTYTGSSPVTIIGLTPPAIAGPTALTLNVGYGATSTGEYTLTGTEPIVVEKTAGDASISWNNGTRKLDIAAGLPAGSYPVTLKAGNGALPDATLTFTLTVQSSFLPAFAVTGNTGGYTYTSGVLTFTAPGDYTVSMADGVTSTTTDKIVAAGGTGATPINITLNGVSIDVSAISGACAFELTGSAAVNLTLASGNSLKSGDGRAGLQVPAGTSLTIGGTGTFSATGGDGGAGIGGGKLGDGGIIAITGGVVTSDGGDDPFGGAGIGGGGCGDGGTVTISGGTVTATGGDGDRGDGAGIGGGTGGDGGSVVITGGSVNSNVQSIPTNGTANGIQPLSLTETTLPGASAGTKVTGLTIPGASYYGANDLFTDADGKLYLWLPADAALSQARTADTVYNNVSGALVADADKPAIASVTPSGAGAALSGDIAVTFSEEMRTGAGTVSLNGTALAGGTWSSGNTVFTIPYTGLAYGTAYTVTISGFKDYSGNTMDADATHSFTTQAAPASLPAVTTSATVTGITASGATVTGSVTSDGGAAVTARGFVYGTDENPVIGGAGVTQATSGSGTGAFTTNISALTANTTYHVRAYATNREGTSYGANVTFTTLTGGGSSNNDSSDDSGSGGRTTVIIQPEKKPDQPVMAGLGAAPTVNSSGHATVTISQQSVEDAIAKALADAKAQGKTANGIGISLNIDLPDTAKSLGIVLPRDTLQSLVNAGVKQLEINGVILSLDLDLEALKEIQRQSTGDVTITIKPAQNLSAAAEKLIGARPVYDVSVSYVKDGKTVNITSLGTGSATLSIPYTPGQNEAIGYLFGVYVDTNGQATRISGSAYDTGSGSVILDSSHFSIYGVGYTAPTEKYTDIASHWAKESIDYAVGRGLFSGTTDTNFSPNTAMDRGMLVTVLGRLAGADVSVYKTSSFTDVAADKYYLPYVEWAYKKGIVSGIGNGKFAPERAVTREEIALILQNYAKATGFQLPVTREVITFADNSSISSTYAGAIKAMQQAGIMVGGSGNKFNPKSGATRAEVAAMLHRYVKLTIDPATAQGWALNDDGRYMYYKDGKPLTGWQTIDGVRYHFYSTGVLQTGWVKDGSNWRFYSGNRALVGWWDIGSETSKKRYYFDVNAVMVSGKWLEIDDKWYYFYTDGSLARNTKIGEYEVDESGVRKAK
ncbi:Fibronectin, type III [Syntrophomonas zehnderi OL-4]|uniref:Fibronectin, type III n=1 Tax=Syntrophomonas zehnderi OL-4 TaxID=690567 RepID=A0A0E4C7X1_9FIRM|nr:Fibronectin, type III [Syntrophomonas zehnderi OL-4]